MFLTLFAPLSTTKNGQSLNLGFILRTVQNNGRFRFYFIIIILKYLILENLYFDLQTYNL